MILWLYAMPLIFVNDVPYKMNWVNLHHTQKSLQQMAGTYCLLKGAVNNE
jgi:hypothetical protein